MSTINTCRGQEQVTGNTVSYTSPHKDELESFDNPGSYPDLEFFIVGMENPLLLHRKILAEVSEEIKALLGNTKEQKLKWPHDTSNAADRNALVKALRFCYGETLVVGTRNGECCAMIAALSRLKVKLLDDILQVLCNFAIEEARRDVFVGVELLNACVGYKECCGVNHCTLNREIASIVLTKGNMFQHFREVVDNCLMQLPQEYLSFVEYSEPHTMCSEYRLRVRYMRNHSKDTSREEKEAIIGEFDWSTLNSDELKELQLLDIIDKDKLLEAYDKALVYCENESQKEKEKTKKAEMEKDKTVKRVERERDEKVEQARREKEEYQRQFETMQGLIRVNRLL